MTIDGSCGPDVGAIRLCTEGGGQVVVRSTRELKAGECVLVDRPIIRIGGRGDVDAIVSKLSVNIVARLIGFCQRQQLDANRLMASMRILLCETKPVVDTILNLFCPDPDREQLPEFQQQWKQVAQTIAMIRPILETAGCDPDLILRLFHTIDCNAFHGEDETDSYLYRIASRFQHSCAPTCSLVQDKAGSISIYMLCPLLPDQDLSLSYIPFSMLSRPAEHRQRRLRCTKYFQCCCQRCQSYDQIGSIRCSEDACPGSIVETTRSCQICNRNLNQGEFDRARDGVRRAEQLISQIEELDEQDRPIDRLIEVALALCRHSRLADHHWTVMTISSIAAHCDRFTLSQRIAFQRMKISGLERIHDGCRYPHQFWSLEVLADLLLLRSGNDSTEATSLYSRSSDGLQMCFGVHHESVIAIARKMESAQSRTT